jgi:hypothetical protein
MASHPRKLNLGNEYIVAPWDVTLSFENSATDCSSLVTRSMQAKAVRFGVGQVY